MICKSCGGIVTRVRILKGRESCGKCGGFSEAGGVRTDGILSRQRTRDQGVKYEGDTLNPWLYNKAEKAFVPNDDFIKLHAKNAQNFYQPKDLKQYPKLADKIKNRVGDTTQVESVGDTAQAMQEVISNS